MSLVVIMAEKANAGRDIAEAIGLKNIQKIDGGFLSGEEGDSLFIIVHSQGNCLRLLEPEEINPNYEKWKLEDLPIIFDDDDLKPNDTYSAKRYGAIKSYLQKADYIINAGDAGREGELIQRWILKKAEIKKPVGRLWSSSLTKDAIQKAYDNLLGASYEEQHMLDNLYYSGATRHIMDKLIGYNYSRLISLTKTQGVTVNYGRCKSPIIHAIVERDNEIENFVKRPYSYITVSLKSNDSIFDGILICEDGKKREFDTRDDAENFVNKLNKNKNGKVISYKAEIKVKNPPKPYDILTLQKKMSEMYGFNADKTLNICQGLYDEHKILSYPRTDSRYLTTDLQGEVKEKLQALNFGKFKTAVNKALPHEAHDRYFNNLKVTDHHAIIPVSSEGEIEKKYGILSEDEKRVFDEAARSFITIFLPGCKYEAVSLITDVSGEKIKSTEKHILEEGYLSIYPKENRETEDYLSSGKIPKNIEEGTVLNVEKIDISDTETKPKQHFTTASLLDYMKIHNIGTGATRHEILSEILKKKGANYSSSVKKDGKYYIATDFGKKMDELIPEKLKSIEFLSGIDTRLKAIENGELSKEEFMRDVQEEFESIYREMTTNKEILMKNIKEKKISNFECPFCKEKLEDKGWGYVCQNWQKDGKGCNYSIPKKIAGKIISDKILKELIKTGKTKEKVKGFKSKAGKKFDAFLLYNLDGDNKVNIQFDFNRKK